MECRACSSYQLLSSSSSDGVGPQSVCVRMNALSVVRFPPCRQLSTDGCGTDNSEVPRLSMSTVDVKSEAAAMLEARSLYVWAREPTLPALRPRFSLRCRRMVVLLFKIRCGRSRWDAKEKGGGGSGGAKRPTRSLSRAEEPESGLLFRTSRNSWDRTGSAFQQNTLQRSQVQETTEGLLHICAAAVDYSGTTFKSRADILAPELLGLFRSEGFLLLLGLQRGESGCCVVGRTSAFQHLLSLPCPGPRFPLTSDTAAILCETDLNLLLALFSDHVSEGLSESDFEAGVELHETSIDSDLELLELLLAFLLPIVPRLEDDRGDGDRRESRSSGTYDLAHPSDGEAVFVGDVFARDLEGLGECLSRGGDALGPLCL